MAIEWTKTGPKTHCAKISECASVAVGETGNGAFWLSLYVNHGQRLVIDSVDAAKAEALGIARRMLVEAVEALGEEK